jgi:tetratricopeptide (TPR) repeat protein
VPPPPKANKEAVGEHQRRRYEESVTRALDERVARYVAQAEEAERTGNVVGAANALRIAKSLKADDPALAAHLARVDDKATSVLHKQYLEQAQYEERQGRFPEAARSYERAIRGKEDSAALHDRAAFCYLEGQLDLKKASELARRAVEMAPTSSAYRITLARIYAQAGMVQSALSELERARTADPSNDTIKDWIKRLRRGHG